MKKDAYKKVQYYFKAVPEYDGVKKKTKIYYLIFYNGMAGNELVVSKTKKELSQFKKNLKEKIITEGTTTFNQQLFHSANNEKIYEEHLSDWSNLYDLIEKDQIINKERFHWTYRNYNHEWRILIIYAKTELEKFKNLNNEIYDQFFHSIDSIGMSNEILKEITQLKLIENTINQIEKVIKKVHFFELETDFEIKDNEEIKPNLIKIEALNKIFNYRHPSSYRHVPWLRGIKVNYNSQKRRYNIHVDILSKEPYSSSYNTAPKSPKEHFENTYEVENISTEIHYQKLGYINYPLYQKYIFPFYKTHNCKNYINIQLDLFKDEYNYNKLFNEDFKIYEKRIEFVLKEFKKTKLYLEKILKAFNPSKFDEKFKEYIYSLVKNEEELWYMPSCRYQYHDHEIVHCVEEHHKFLEIVISIFNKLLTTKNVESIKMSYSPFDELFTKIDSSFIINMLNDLGVIDENKFILNKKELGAFRGIVIALKEFNLMEKENLIRDIKTFARNFEVNIKNPLNTTDISETYRNLTKEYLNQAGLKKNEGQLIPN